MSAIQTKCKVCLRTINIIQINLKRKEHHCSVVVIVTVQCSVTVNTPSSSDMFQFQIKPTIVLKDNMLKMMELKLHIRQLSLSESVCSSDDSESSSSTSTSSSISPSSSSFLTRQSSTSSLPSKKTRQNENGVFRNRHRLSYSFQRIRKRPKTPGEESARNNNISLLPEQYSELKKVHADFEQFLNVVVDDLKEKVEKLKAFRVSEGIGVHEKNYTNLQIYMMDKYSSRIESFRTISCHSIESICIIHNQRPSLDISNLVNKVSCSYLLTSMWNIKLLVLGHLDNTRRFTISPFQLKFVY